MNAKPITEDSLAVFAELLGQVSVCPMAPDADKQWARVYNARVEVVDALKQIQDEKKQC